MPVKDAGIVKPAKLDTFALSRAEASGGGKTSYQLQVVPLDDGRTEVQVLVSTDSLTGSNIALSYPDKYVAMEGAYGDWPADCGAVQQSADMRTPGVVNYQANLSKQTPAAGNFRLLSVIFKAAAPTAPAQTQVSPERWTPTLDLPAPAPSMDPSLPVQPGHNKWPQDNGAREWLQRYYLTLPGLGSSFGPYQSAAEQSAAAEVFELTNAARTDKGLTPLVRDPHLDAVAQAHVVHMAQAGFFEHKNPYGMEVFERLNAVDAPSWWSAGENISMGYPNAAAAFKGWMDSKGHKKNIRYENYRDIGIGVYRAADGTMFWAQVFASFDSDPNQHDWIEPGEQL